ncbi:MAG TPA: hypothetical protein VG013_05820 [Gemmataceae bacterium]|jgi:hypothetical protein|nr:hypothetical protein [Gemmataceae bacterium]
MILEARPANCCSSTFVLKVDDRAVGKFDGRWFSENLDVSLTGRRRLQFQKASWLGSQFVLQDADGEEPLGRAGRAGMFTNTWDLELSTGPAQLVKAGWLATGYEVQQGKQALARVDRLGWCTRGWYVEKNGPLKAEDLILVGLVYHVILQRQAHQHAAGGHAAGS